MEFFNTVMGKRFYTNDIPQIANALESISKSLNKKVEYDIVETTDIISAGKEGWRFVTQLQDGKVLMKRSI
jgi:glutaredoxin-related protein